MKCILITLLPLMALTACSDKGGADGTTELLDSGSAAVDSGTSADDTQVTGSDTTDGTHDTSVVDDELYGSYPAVALSVPEFTATHYDGSERSRADLEGHYTIMWFYPLAGTAG